jgi:Protein of unknown function (DUF1360)
MASEQASYLHDAAESEQRRDDTPTTASDYLAVNAVYGALAATVLFSTRKQYSRDPISGRELLPISAATFALSKVIAREKIGSWMREPFVEMDHGERKPRGRGLRRVVGELVTCTRCVGAWSALGIVGLRLAAPASGRIVTNVLAASAGNDWLQAGFKMLTASANRLEQPPPQ